ncbi:hypothetical protein [Chitinophaga nivalis]|uniref:DUF4271 domain-containing protein n=1 Tax=Chitinophaga nivalis TaxID=2991709 RepID=A0ABT3IJF3_9BACT|nr:hypothetical protein [Chitinophaga nivalis]MCW3466199.1 hypothetical protein [Chitinophaga nivalis]MCW3484110.1 hypothetical protein [Chitinophaga nivalis]
MRILKILCLLLLTSQLAVATDARLAKTLEALTPQQRTVLYQYGTLRLYATAAQADSFRLRQQYLLPDLTPEDAATLATELMTNTTLVYSLQQPSRLQALRGVFTASRLLLGLAALVAAYALIHLLYSYWSRCRDWLVRYLSPLFRRLFSPRMLTWQLLLIGIAGIFLGPRIPDIVLRTLLVHAGLFLLWAQLTAITTREYNIRRYMREIKYSLRSGEDPWLAFKTVSLPAIAISAGIAWVMQHCPDPWYPYEVTVPMLAGLFTLPPLRRLEIPLSRVLLPFPHTVADEEQRTAAYVTVSLFIWVGLLFLPVIMMPSLLVLTFLLIIALLLLSIAKLTRCGMRNYSWLQAVTLVFLCSGVLAGAQLGILVLSWMALGGIVLYVLIKYWEIPALLGWSWKDRKALGLLGMAALIWAIAALFRYRPEWFVFF